MSGWTLRAVCWAPCSPNCKHMTMPPPITAIPSSNLQMTQLWWGFSLGVMSLPAGTKWSNWQRGAQTTTWSWTHKTEDLIVDFRRRRLDIQPLYISEDRVERVPDFRFLGVHFMENLAWDVNMAELAKKASQRLYFLRILRKSNISQKLLVSFCRCSIESILCYWLCVWFSSCTAAQRKTLQWIIKTAQETIGRSLPTLKELHSSRCRWKAKNILKHYSHPGHNLFQLLLSGNRYRGIKTRTNRL